MAVFNFTWGGQLYGDIWQCTMHMEGNPSLSGQNYDDMLNDIKGDTVKWFGAINPCPGVKLSFVKFNEIDPVTRRYVSQTDSHELTFPPVSGSGSTNFTASASLCVSLLTGAKRGLAARGRIYPPVTPSAVAVGSDGMVIAGNRDALAAATKTFINDLNEWPGATLPGSPKVVVLGRDGSHREVTQVSVGSVPDTQRRRRNALVETYTVVSL